MKTIAQTANKIESQMQSSQFSYKRPETSQAKLFFFSNDLSHDAKQSNRSTFIHSQANLYEQNKKFNNTIYRFYD